jgi:hypothetical protein
MTLHRHLGQLQGQMCSVQGVLEKIDRRLEQGDERMTRMEKDDRVLGARIGKLERRERGTATGTPAQETGKGWLAGLTLKDLLTIGSSIGSLAKLPLPWSTLGWWAAGLSAGAVLMPKWVAGWLGQMLIAWAGGSGG